MATSEALASGQRVKYVGITGRADGKVGRVSRVCRSYVKVRWSDGTTEDVHPEDIRVVTR